MTIQLHQRHGYWLGTGIGVTALLPVAGSVARVYVAGWCIELLSGVAELVGDNARN